MADRIKQSHIRQPVQEDQDFEIKKAEEIRIRKENTLQKQKIECLEQINTRLGIELSELQLKSGIHPGNNRIFEGFLKGTGQGFSKSRVDRGSPNKNTAQMQMETEDLLQIEPLLAAYENKINKLEEVITSLQEDMKHLEEASQILYIDNESLRGKLESKCGEILKIYQYGDPQEMSGNIISKLERDDMSERIKILTEENQVLQSKFNEVQSKLVKHETQFGIDQKNSQNYQQLYKESSNKLTDIEIEKDNFKSKVDSLERQLKKLHENNVHLESALADEKNSSRKLKNEIDLNNEQIIKIKENSRENERLKNGELQELRQEIEQYIQSKRELENKQMIQERDLDFLNAEKDRLRNELDETRDQNEVLQRNINKKEEKIEIMKQEEEKLKKIQVEQNRKVLDATLEKDKAVGKEQQLEQTLQALQEKHLDEIDSLKEQQQNIMNQEKLSNKQLIEKLENELSQGHEDIQNYQLEIKKLQKEITNYQNENQRLQSRLREDLHSVYDQKIQQYEKVLAEVEQNYNDLLIRSKEKEKSYQMELQKLEKNIKNNQTLIADFKQVNEKLRLENNGYREEVMQQKNDISQSERDKQELVNNVKKIKSKFEQQIKFTNEDFERKIKTITQQLQEAQKSEQNSRQRAIELFKAHDEIEKEHEEEMEERIKELEDEVKSWKEQCRKLKDLYEEPTKEKDYQTYSKQKN